MALDTLANWAEIIGVLVIVLTIIFGWKQLQHYQLQREARAAIELARYFHNPEFVCALQRLLAPPAAEFEARIASEKKLEDAAMLFSLTTETIGLMVHRRMLPLEMVWELMGGLLTHCWRRIYPWVLRQRELQQSEKFNEWGQWLIEQMQHFEEQGQPQPAHRKYADWTPGNR